MTIKERDVYRFQYNEKHRPPQWRHCFDGQLVVFETANGLILQDSYWSLTRLDRDHGRQFTSEEAAEKGELHFVCNLGEVDPVPEHSTRYYADADVFNLSYQHNCYPYFAVRKGAKRDADKMFSVLREMEAGERRKVEFSMNRLQRIAAAKQQIEDGLIDKVHLP